MGTVDRHLFLQSTIGPCAYDIIEIFAMKKQNFHYICFKATLFHLHFVEFFRPKKHIQHEKIVTPPFTPQFLSSYRPDIRSYHPL